jgi:hypothetical protein
MRRGESVFYEHEAAVGAYVGRSVGFGREFEYEAELTVRASDGGLRTVTEGGHTREGAMMRAKSAARSVLHSRRRATGFGAEGFRTGSGGKASFRVGFA